MKKPAKKSGVGTGHNAREERAEMKNGKYTGGPREERAEMRGVKGKKK
ncbi:hypothetical protein UFOVP1008_43 [uncultured Caudovirales phage]|uniref:Uncharacterized protein n=1 Tax=uncultured Caudovirales phage TaxID=2100421 RepID=A0A6J5QRK9_9CAUD|nr:hypothetical protein UFOVP498_51 [uncultured Caudovirales phage]CAB4177747.1 hypothetical protein UFOVP1008_43 [uncultured Caudovirales phage]CAB4187140.1 hypothetical protein UFOVP1160_3 [uncultured Caudovirales phage]CAB4200403.1 hypothetical protein UFOVP1352_47 [uncultured Caudovirales phage]